MIILPTIEIIERIRGVKAVPTTETLTGGYALAIVVILLFLAVLALVWVILHVVFAIWFVVALWFDWWWVLPAIGISCSAVSLLIRDTLSETERHCSVGVLVLSVVILSLMALIGSYAPAVWSGTGYTRGSGDWIPIWSDEFLENPEKPEPTGICTQDKWKDSSMCEEDHPYRRDGDPPESNGNVSAEPRFGFTPIPVRTTFVPIEPRH